MVLCCGVNRKNEEEGNNKVKIQHTKEYKVVKNVLSLKTWYNPNYSEHDKEEKKGKDTIDHDDKEMNRIDSFSSYSNPSLLKAWDFYENYILYQYKFAEDKSPTKRSFIWSRIRRKKLKKERQNVGEKDITSLYSVYDTTLNDLNDWGIGVYLFFFTLKSIIHIFLAVAFLHVPLLIYYLSPMYNNRDELSGFNKFELTGNWISATTAICTDSEFVYCPNCTIEDWANDKDSFGFSNNSSDGSSLTFARKNRCESPDFGYTSFNYASMFLINIFFLMLIGKVRRESKMKDTERVSSSDYTIVVNSPPNEKNPEVWRDFFAQFETARPNKKNRPPLVTIALNNEDLLKLLIERRRYKIDLESMLAARQDDQDLFKYDVNDTDKLTQLMEKLEIIKANEKTEAENLSKQRRIKSIIINWLQRYLNLCLDELCLCERILKTESDIETLVKTRKFVPSKVFITMETEKGQQNALRQLSVGKLYRKGILRFRLRRNDTKKFQDKYFLDVSLRIRITHNCSPLLDFLCLKTPPRPSF